MKKITEHRNPASSDIHRSSTVDALRVMNIEDAKVAEAVGRSLGEIARLIDGIAPRMKQGGRLIYVGAGTSGRLGVLDASEIPPTFGLPAGRVIGVIAGGKAAITAAVEGAEDDTDAAARDLDPLNIGENDTVVGISASGDTPYAVTAVARAAELGALTGSVTCARDGKLNSIAEIPICIEAGPEVLAGSTRLKAGTAQKMVLNMISTMVMIRLGFTNGNVMTNLVAGNEKLRRRAAGIIISESGLDERAALELLDECGGSLPAAIVSIRTGAAPAASVTALNHAEGVIEKAVQALKVS